LSYGETKNKKKLFHKTGEFSCFEEIGGSFFVFD